MEVKKAYEIIRNGITILLCVGDEPLKTDTITNIFSVLIASDGKELWKDNECVGCCVELVGNDKQENYEERDIVVEDEDNT